MQKVLNPTRLATVMEMLGTNASVLARDSGADHSLISKWQRGSRPLSKRSKQLLPVAKSLLRLDEDGVLEELLAPYRQQGESAVQALCVYLTSKELAALPPRAEAPQRPTSGDYSVEYRVFLGMKGFRHAALAMLDYVMTLPPGREIVVVCQGRYDWIVKDIPFVLKFISRLQKAIDRGAKLQVVNRKGYSIAETSAFAAPWLLAHLRGYIRSRYYEGELPPSVRFVGSIKDYWSCRAEEDPEVADGLYLRMMTDPKDIRADEAVCNEYYEKSRPASQYNFLANPAGGREDLRLWKEGPLPPWNKGAAPDGSFCAMCRVPGIGLMTRDEFIQAAGGDDVPPLPEYLFMEKGRFASGPHRLILCRDDVREGLQKQRSQHDALSMLLHRRAFVTRDQLVAQLNRILKAMEERPDFEVALVPRVAFEKLGMGLVCWRSSVSVGWLLDGGNSVFADDKATSGSFYGALGYIWGKLLAGWKRQDKVRRQLRKWLAGKELDQPEEDSAIVRGWDPLPRE